MATKKNKKTPPAAPPPIHDEYPVGMGPDPLLLWAARHGDAAEMASALAQSASMAALSREGMTAMGLAIRAKSGACVHVLLAAGDDPQRRDKNGATPIYHAVCSGDKHSISTLLVRCGKLMPPHTPGNLAGYARQASHPEVASWLEAHWESLILGETVDEGCAPSKKSMRI